MRDISNDMADYQCAILVRFPEILARLCYLFEMIISAQSPQQMQSLVEAYTTSEDRDAMLPIIRNWLAWPARFEACFAAALEEGLYGI